MDGPSILDGIDVGSAIDPAEPPKKLAVLGLPWDTRCGASSSFVDVVLVPDLFHGGRVLFH
jgi:hypothetical protein